MNVLNQLYLQKLLFACVMLSTKSGRRHSQYLKNPTRLINNLVIFQLERIVNIIAIGFCFKKYHEQNIKFKKANT